MSDEQQPLHAEETEGPESDLRPEHDQKRIIRVPREGGGMIPPEIPPALD